PPRARVRRRHHFHAHHAVAGVRAGREIGSVRDVPERHLHVHGQPVRRTGDLAPDRTCRCPTYRRATARAALRRSRDVRRRLRARACVRRGRPPMTSLRDAPADVTARYEMVVALEVHVQLRTRTKAFCSCDATYGAPPNINTCPVCGALPALNREAVHLAMRAAHALGCTVNPVSVFARKNYFYPDLPKGYQISQYDRPLALAGRLEIGDGDAARTVGITRVHMEEDAGKSIHDRYPGATAIDLNRAGVPLIEIVSEPDMRSSTEAVAYLAALKQILEYIDVSDVNMEEGSLRVDANVSARRRGATTLGTKTEVKNMNSFSGVQRALDAEFQR